jgi:hypothetical protein
MITRLRSKEFQLGEMGAFGGMSMDAFWTVAAILRTKSPDL